MAVTSTSDQGAGSPCFTSAYPANGPAGPGVPGTSAPYHASGYIP
ncbi:hypothetical protein ASZ90_016361 [hydrocarbon metagenome]|uniref:Uncharacterized protein n=1 Tax=hydrocarbon metagenome TaxID=938273 RepID=A0A0W8EXZ4_9ZZZZ